MSSELLKLFCRLLYRIYGYQYVANVIEWRSIQHIKNSLAIIQQTEYVFFRIKFYRTIVFSVMLDYGHVGNIFFLLFMLKSFHFCWIYFILIFVFPYNIFVWFSFSFSFYLFSFYFNRRDYVLDFYVNIFSKPREYLQTESLFLLAGKIWFYNWLYVASWLNIDILICSPKCHKY